MFNLEPRAREATRTTLSRTKSQGSAVGDVKYGQGEEAEQSTGRLENGGRACAIQDRAKVVAAGLVAENVICSRAPGGSLSFWSHPPTVSPAPVSCWTFVYAWIFDTVFNHL